MLALCPPDSRQVVRSSTQLLATSATPRSTLCEKTFRSPSAGSRRGSWNFDATRGGSATTFHLRALWCTPRRFGNPSLLIYFMVPGCQQCHRRGVTVFYMVMSAIMVAVRRRTKRSRKPRQGGKSRQKNVARWTGLSLRSHEDGGLASPPPLSRSSTPPSDSGHDSGRCAIRARGLVPRRSQLQVSGDDRASRDSTPLHL